MNRTKSGKDFFGYHAMMQSAFRGVLRTALQKTVKLGALPGDHHFYITFRTRAPGVQMPDHLKDRFVDEMTIVIQHQYFDLDVTDDAFTVVLKFGGEPHRLFVPFAAVSRFVDPSVDFIVAFDPSGFGVQVNAPQAAPQEAEEPPRDATVVSLDAFRRK